MTTHTTDSVEFLSAARAAHSALADIHKAKDKRPHAPLVQAHRDVTHAMKVAEVHSNLAIAAEIKALRLALTGGVCDA